MYPSEENPLPIAKLEYRIFPAMSKARVGDPILQMRGMVSMADYHFRVNVERMRVDPLTVTTRIEWDDGTCRFVIEAPASEEVLSIAFDEALRLIGLRAKPSSKLAHLDRD